MSQKEKKNTPIPPKPKPASFDPATVDLPSALDTAEFRETWQDWCADRAERRKPITHRAAKLQLRKLIPFAPEVACEMIRESIANGWSGIFPLKHQDNKFVGQQVYVGDDPDAEI